MKLTNTSAFMNLCCQMMIVASSSPNGDLTWCSTGNEAGFERNVGRVRVVVVGVRKSASSWCNAGTIWAPFDGEERISGGDIEEGETWPAEHQPHLSNDLA